MARVRQVDPAVLSPVLVAQLRAERVARWRRFGRWFDDKKALADGAPFLFHWEARSYFAGPDDRPREIYEGRPSRDRLDPDSDMRFVDTGAPIPHEMDWSGSRHWVGFC